MSFLFLDHHASFSKTINAPIEAVLGMLHDAPAFMKLSPLIIKVSVDPTNGTNYSVVDSLVLPFGYCTEITYQAKIVLQEAGMRAESVAGAGTRTASVYTAKAVSEGVTLVEEHVKVNSFFLLLPFIKGVIAKAHTETLNRLAARLEETRRWCIQRLLSPEHC